MIDLPILAQIPPILRFHLEARPTPDHREIYYCRWCPSVYLSSLLGARREKHLFEDVRFFVCFAAFARSGHSLLGALLDAHPNMIIAHELDAFYLMDAGFSREQLFHMILRNSRGFAKMGRGWSGYSYEAPDQWQGRFERLRVVGDKKSPLTVNRLMRQPSLLDRARKCLRAGIRIILYLRNPFDVMTTNARRCGKPAVGSAEVDHFFGVCRALDWVRSHVDRGEVIEVRHEEMLRDPPGTLARVVESLREDCPASLLRAASGLVNPVPHKSRHEVSWSPDLISRVQNELQQFSFLSGYRF